MRRVAAIILTLFWALSLSAKDYLAELDGYIRNREAYDQAKEERIEAARARLRSMTRPDDKYAV